MNSHLRVAALTLATVTGAAAARAQGLAELTIEPNTNQHAAGRLSENVLTLHLVAREGTWHPEGPDSPGLRVATFAEENGPLVTPGPLVRVQEGTTIVVSVRNTLKRPLTIHGFVTRPTAGDDVFMVPAETVRETRFIVGAPGTYSYWAAVGGPNVTLATRTAVDGQLGGAFIVDRRGVMPHDRVFAMTEWVDRPRFIFAINGQSWPFSERLTEQVGSEVEWKWVNLTRTTHPMHLHGFYFDVLGLGTPTRYEQFAPDAIVHEVTQYMPVAGTMTMRWVPERPGNWLFHCHLANHISPDRRFWATDHADHASHELHDPATAMSGLVMGITVVGDASLHTNAPARPITLAMYRRPHFFGEDAAYGFAIKRGDSDPSTEDVTVPGPPLILTRGEPVEITLHNKLDEPTAVHWHGIELDSFYDGVPGFSGASGSTTPAIGPGESIVVRFTPRRAGTFIYHTHSHDNHQLASGLYGAIVVVEPGQRFDPERDHIVVLGMIGAFDAARPDRIPIAANGNVNAQLKFKAGATNRVRLINIAADADLTVSLQHLHEFLPWTPVAKDGADLPPGQRRSRTALAQVVGAGETYDFEVFPPADGNLWLNIGLALNGRWVRQVVVAIAP